MLNKIIEQGNESSPHQSKLLNYFSLKKIL